MRMMMQVEMGMEKFNAAVSDGTAGAKIQSILEDAQPESAFFGEANGKRGGVFVVDVASPSDIIRFSEPWFLLFDAKVEWRVCMTPEDVAGADLAEIGRKWA